MENIINEKIGILVVNYNNLEYTKNCVSDLFKQINQNFELWVLDQNSKEVGTKEYLNELRNKNVKVVENTINSDLNKVWNYFHENCKLEYLCFLNNDIRLTNNFTDDIIRIFEKESNVGAVIHVTNNPKHIKAEHNLNYEILNPPLYQGWDFCFRREAYTKIPDSLRIFGGDDFLFGGLRDKGFKIAMTYSSPIIHFKEKTRVKFGSEIHTIQASDNKYYHIERQKRGFQHTDTTMGKMSNKYPPDNIKLIQNKNCIYTTIIGKYDELPTVNFKKNNWDYVCFTDNKKLKSDVWKIVYYSNDNSEPLNNSKLSRYFKTNFFKFLISYENILYVDARMEIIGDIDNYLKNLNNCDFVFLKHPNANNINDEMNRVLNGNLEKPEMIKKIKERYKVKKYQYDNGLFVGGVLLFRNNENVINFFKWWWGEIKEYSHRDQLSLNYVLFRCPNLNFKFLKFYDVINVLIRQKKRISKRLIFNNE